MRILIPLDGSTESETAVAAAMPLLRSGEAGLTLLRVAENAQQLDAARQGVERAAESLGHHGVSAESRVRLGVAASEILAAASEEGADLIALTTHGRTGMRRILMGSVAHQLLRRAEVPLLIHRPDTPAGGWSRIAVALDGSPLAERILDDLIPIARRIGSTLRLVAVQPPAVGEPGPAIDLERERVRLTQEGIQATADLRQGLPVPELCRFVKETGSGLLALTTHGRTGQWKAILGGVAEELIRCAPCTLLIRRVLFARTGAREERTAIRPGEPLS